MTRTAYLHKETAPMEYTGEALAQEDPLNPGNWLLPAHAVWIQPPGEQTGYARVWNGSAWEQVEDHRGQIVWHDWETSMEIKELGPIPEGWSPERPEKPVTVDDYDQAMEQHLYAERAERGYTTREPSPYYDNSANTRWKQDAADWRAHRDAVMEYALQVENDFEEGKPVPTLPEFKELLPKIQWTIEL